MRRILMGCFLYLLFAVAVAKQQDNAYTLSAVNAVAENLVFAHQQDNAYKVDKEYQLSPSGKLTLKCSDAKVSITGSQRNNARVRIFRSVINKGLWINTKDEFHVNIQESNGDLFVEERQRNSSIAFFGYANIIHTINIELPETASLEIKGTDGDFLIRHVNGIIAADVDDADIDVVDCLGSDFRFDMEDGNLKVDKGKGKLEVTASDGNVAISNGNFVQINASIRDGNLDVSTSIANEGQYQINAGDGSVSFAVLNGGGTFDVRHGDRRVTAEGKFKRIEDSDDRKKFELGNGTAKVNIRAGDARIRLVQAQ